MKRIATLVLAVLMVLSLFACAAADETAAVMTHDEYVAAELETEVTVETYVQAHQSWWNDQITIYAQSEDGAYFIYNAACDAETAEKLVPGTKIRVNGFKGEWAGEVEIVDGTIEIIEDAEPWIAEAEDVTELLGTDELADHMNEYVSFTGTVAAYKVNKDDAEGFDFAYAWDNSGSHDANSDLYFTVVVNGVTYTFTVEYYLCNETTEVYEAVRSLNVGDVVDLEGFLYWYNGANPHITAVAPVVGE